MSRFERQFGPVYEAIRRDIFKFCALMNFRPTWQQAEVLALVQAGHKRIAVKSGQGPGKTTCSVIVGIWRTLRHVDALTVVTAPTMRQAKGVWLSECRRLMEKADPALQRFIEVTKSTVQVAGRPDWGVRLVTATRAENAQGLHQDNLTVIVEEASGIERDIIEQFQGTLTNDDALLFMIGNPNCVLGHTEIYDPSRGRVTAKDYGAGRVVAMCEKSLRLSAQDARGIYSGQKECVRVTLAAGQQIEVSVDHPIYTQRGWVCAADLSLDDLVATPRRLPSPERFVDYTDDEVKFVAYMLTDGCVTWQKGNHPRCSFSQQPGPVLDEYLNLAMVAGNATVRDEPNNKAKRVDVSGASDLLRRLGIAGQDSKTKRVPSDFFLLPDRQLGLLINRMWACDGSFNRYGPKMCLANRKMLEDIRTLLLRWGIHSRVWYTPVRSKKTFAHLNGREFDAWTLAITERESVLLWLQHVGEVLGKEGKCPLPAGSNPNSDVVPVTTKEIVECLDELTLPRKGGERSRLRTKYSRVRWISRAAFAEFCTETGYAGRHARFATSDVRWEKVLAVESIGTHSVYDLTVPARGNFVAENIIIHNTRDCAFFDCFNSQRHRWATLTLNAEESPIVSRENIEHMREVYGEDSDVYRIRVLGEFPHMDPNCVISSEDCERATDKRRFLECMKMHRSNGGGLAKQFGIDLARFGSDESVIYRRLGNAVMPDWRTFSKVEPGHVIEHAFKMQSEAMWSDKECWYVPDAGGMGQGVMSKLYDARKQVFEFHTQGASSKPDYANRMTEAWFHVADLFKKGHIYIPKDNRLIQQLSTRQYHITKKGKLIVESKEEYKKRSTDEEGASPDRADALVMAFYDQVVVRGQVSGAPAGKTVGIRARIA